MSREKLFSVTAADCEFQYFAAGGPGGQKQNKTASACRCVHMPSRAVGESRTHREQHLNKRDAFKKMVQSDLFQKWLSMRVKKELGQLAQIEQQIEMELRKVKVEVKDETGKWVPAKDDILKYRKDYEAGY